MSTSPQNYFWLSLSLAAALVAAGCHGNSDSAVDQNPSQDPSQANIAPISNTTAAPADTGAAPADNPPPSGSYSSPPSQSAPSDQYASDQSAENYDSYDQPVDYAPEPPPALPQYDQPPCPGDDYMWTPGYWAYSPQGYYWAPGAWVMAPYQGALWTPGFWGSVGGRYGFHRGYWARHVGFYGGVNYGFGYVGSGYHGGYWSGPHFAYNRTVNNVNTTVVHNVYNYTVINNVTNITRISYNGGAGGITVRPRPAEIVAIREQHAPPMTAQVRQEQEARAERANFVAVNHGRPATMVASRPLSADHIQPPPMVVRQEPQPRPEVARPAPEPARPQPQERPVAQPEARPEARPSPAPPQRPEPVRPQPQRAEPVRSQPRPQPQRTEPARPQQHPEARPAPQRPAPERPNEKRPEERRPQ